MSPRRRALAAVRGAGLATMWTAAGMGIAVLSYIMLAAVLTVALLCLVGIGLLLIGPTLAGVRAVADLERRRLRAIGHRVVSPYGGPPTSLPAAVRSLAAPEVRRDFGWLACNVTFGIIVAALGVQLAYNVVRYATFPLWWSLVPPHKAYALNGYVAVDSWQDAFLMAATAPLWAALWLFLEPRLMRAQALPGAALLNPHPDVDLSARLAELTTSRAAVLSAHAAELRRIERALHDGVQNRLVGVAVLAGVARQALARDPAQADAALERMQGSVEDALAELRSVVRSILPPVLEDLGLEGALSALAADSAVPCRVTTGIAARSPAAVEATAYFAVTEALTNAARHSGAGEVLVDVRRTADRLVAVVRDDGRGGADSAAGSGLDGIVRRVQALDGEVAIDSPPGGPTVVTVELPCES
ncbi:sensor histidine kinase [Streptomonospora sediminis]